MPRPVRLRGIRLHRARKRRGMRARNTVRLASSPGSGPRAATKAARPSRGRRGGSANIPTIWPWRARQRSADPLHNLRSQAAARPRSSRVDSARRQSSRRRQRRQLMAPAVTRLRKPMQQEHQRRTRFAGGIGFEDEARRPAVRSRDRHGFCDLGHQIRRPSARRRGSVRPSRGSAACCVAHPRVLSVLLEQVSSRRAGPPSSGFSALLTLCLARRPPPIGNVAIRRANAATKGPISSASKIAVQIAPALGRFGVEIVAAEDRSPSRGRGRRGAADAACRYRRAGYRAALPSD